MIHIWGNEENRASSGPMEDGGSGGEVQSEAIVSHLPAGSQGFSRFSTSFSRFPARATLIPRSWVQHMPPKRRKHRPQQHDITIKEQNRHPI
jgi:hypothetical protein